MQEEVGKGDKHKLYSYCMTGDSYTEGKAARDNSRESEKLETNTIWQRNLF